jgi:methyl-accepting chemotaxis protein
MFSRFSISGRLFLFVPLLVIALAAVILLSLLQLRQIMMADREETVRHLVQVASHVLESWHEQEQTGILTREQAQKGAHDELTRLRYAQDGYYFVQGSDGMSIVAFDPAREGKMRLDTVDAEGVAFVRDEIAVAHKGGGFTRFRSPMSEVGLPVPKMAYTVEFQPWGWTVGSTILLDDIDVLYRRLMLEFIGLGLVVLVLAGVAARLIARSVSAPLGAITGRMVRLAEGDHSIDLPYLDDRHEIGRLAHALEVFKLNRQKSDELAREQAHEQAAKLARQERVEKLIEDFAGRATGALRTVVSAANQVQTNAGQLASLAGTSLEKVAGASRASADTTGNVSTIAGAAEELSSAVREVNQQVGQSSEVAGRAVDQAQRTGATVHDLTEQAARIGNIVALISDIASQTNLLALNATIEAARAGEAGKGFAVVAGEVKTLAAQTAKATEEIQSQVNGIRAETERAEQAIDGIVSIVADMKMISSSIESAMEQQDATTQEIARHIVEAAQGTQLVSENINGVAEAAEVTDRAASELRGASEELQREADSLQKEMTAFFAALRAA